MNTPVQALRAILSRGHRDASHDGRAHARPVYFRGTRDSLFGWWHEPVGRARRSTAVVLVAPLAHEYMYAHRSVRALAERLSTHGYPVLRYDHFGVGDSPGADTDAGLVDTWRRDVRAAVAAAREAAGAARVVVVGLRAGALLALAAPGDEPIADGFVAWSAVANGRQFTRELGALSAASASRNGDRVLAGVEPGGVSFAGFTLSPETVGALSALKVAGVVRRPAERVLLVERDDFKADDALAGHLESSGTCVDRERLPGYSAMMVDALLGTVPGAMIDATVGWAERHYPEHATDAHASPHAPFASVLTLRVDDAEVRETPLFVDGGRTAFGVLTEPAAPPAERGTCVLMLNTGGDHHVGPNRLYVEFARRWAPLGCACLRVDVHGFGDVAPAHGSPGVDAYPDDAMTYVAALLQYLKRDRGFARVVVGGVCSGAYHSVEAARLGLPVDGIFAVNPQLYFNRESGASGDADVFAAAAAAAASPGSAGELAAADEAGAVRIRLRRYKRTLTSTASRALAPLIHAVDRALHRVVGRGLPGESLFNRACDSLVVFSLGDLGLYYLETRVAVELARLRANPKFRLEIVGDADHTFTYRSAQAELTRVLTAGLRERLL